MRSRGGTLIVLSALLVGFSGCGEEGERFADAKITDAAKVQNSKVKGDPFCAVDQILNDADEIRKAKRQDAVIITSKGGNVGVAVVPPFPNDCEAIVVKGLSKLDPKPKEE